MPLEKQENCYQPRIPQGKNIELASNAEKVPDNCFIVCWKDPALPKVISAVGVAEGDHNSSGVGLLASSLTPRPFL
jgi:hypothetical protein